MAFANFERDAGQQEAEQSIWKEVLAILGENTITNNQQILAYLGQAFYRTGRIEESRIKFERVLALKQETIPTIKRGPRWWYMTMILARLGESEKAKDYFDKLCAELGDDASKNELRFKHECAKLLGVTADQVRGRK